MTRWTVRGTAGRRSAPRTAPPAFPAAVAAASVLGLVAALGGVVPASGQGAGTGVRGAQAVATVASPASLVDPLIGTSNYGNTTPAAAMPFGMVEWGPATADRPVGNYANGQPLTGLSVTDAQGAGCRVLGDVPILPALFSGPAPALADPTAASAVLAGQQASPGQWDGMLDQTAAPAGPMAVDLAVTTRSGIAKVAFPGSAAAYPGLLVKAGDSLAGDTAASVTVGPDGMVEGRATSAPFCGAPAASAVTVYFALQSQQAPVSVGTWSAPAGVTQQASASGAGSGAWLSFAPGTTLVRLKVGVSYVSEQDAMANIGAEDPGWSESAVAQSASAAWSSLLGRVAVTGGTLDQQQVFYTALYHSLLAPQTVSDANGAYLGFDGTVHHLPAGQAQYSMFSGWDIQGSQFALLSVLTPGRAAQMAQSLVRDAEQGGWLPRWPLASSYTGVMEGDPADELIAEAVAFGATAGLDQQTALLEMWAGSAVPQSYSPSDDGQGYYLERYGLTQFNTIHYVPGDASLSLQYALDDFAIARVAATLGDTALADQEGALARSWKELLDPAASLPGSPTPTSGAIEPRCSASPTPCTASSPFSSTSVVAPSGAFQQAGFMEGNAAQYTWLVQDDLQGLASALGGDAVASGALAAFLGSLDAPAQQPNYTAANEQALEAPWEGDAFGAPALTQLVGHRIAARLYPDTTAGIPGNDDLGELSSWLVWDDLGLYPEIPGTDLLAVGSPLFPSVTVRSGATQFTVRAPGAGTASPYVQSATLGGRGLLTDYLSFHQLAGSTLTLSMGPSPDGALWSTPSAWIPSMTPTSSAAGTLAAS